MITFNQKFYNNLARYVKQIQHVCEKLNSTDIVINAMHSNAFSFDTYQFKVDNPLRTNFVTVVLKEGEEGTLPVHLFGQLRVDFFDLFAQSVGKELFDLLVVCPQLDATFSIRPDQLDDVVLGALVLKYMHEYYMQVREICLIKETVDSADVFNLLHLSNAISDIKLPNFKNVTFNRWGNFLDEHVLAIALMRKHTIVI